MAHIGQKPRFGFVGRLGFLLQRLGAPQLPGKIGQQGRVLFGQTQAAGQSGIEGAGPPEREAQKQEKHGAQKQVGAIVGESQGGPQRPRRQRHIDVISGQVQADTHDGTGALPKDDGPQDQQRRVIHFRHEYQWGDAPCQGGQGGGHSQSPRPYQRPPVARICPFVSRPNQAAEGAYRQEGHAPSGNDEPVQPSPHGHHHQDATEHVIGHAMRCRVEKDADALRGDFLA